MEFEILLRFEYPDQIHSVVIEDDGQVAYAFIRESEKIVSALSTTQVQAEPTARQLAAVAREFSFRG